ncbi:aldehyde dehydrogenase family protein [Xenorhabdus bovienii]|uniref:aldehyde dehydrogenase family protein n=1 Tax=Xenorhabdus bovienii TaxID=40576 RepID=UPI0023B33155|nr:aldehyde dehydrogenase family protein [Xenorhabdus bovienii]MDE9535328.1 aldehyde dehydrogenase family protein [Xenorhabdus bovienii]MDE9588689.1 aldehyde dehydrogenase family protein [Xenorhabdus bovienii]
MTINENIDITVQQTETVSYIDKLVDQGKIAQKELEKQSDEDIDNVLHHLAKIFSTHCREWAEKELAVTRIGNADDKEHKLALVVNQVFKGLYGTKTYGRLGGTQRLIEYASPVGLIFAVVPLTNPIPNSLFKIMLSIKTRNAIIFSYPGKTGKLADEFIDLVQQVLTEHGLPVSLVQVCTPPSHDKTHMLMQHPGVDMILATGGKNLVHAAYSSGKPAFGVGPGNVPVYISRSANIQKAAANIVNGKIYDNGIVCGSESNLIVHPASKNDLISALEANGAAILTSSEVEQAIQTLFNPETQYVSRENIGVCAASLAAKANISRAYPIKLLVIPAEIGRHDFLSNEKMVPVLTLYTADEENGISLAYSLICNEGAGHTAVIHSEDPDEIHQFSTVMPAGRILVNTSATQGMLGETTELPVSFMQGSGTFGHNHSTDPIIWKHLVNIKRVAYGLH